MVNSRLDIHQSWIKSNLGIDGFKIIIRGKCTRDFHQLVQPYYVNKVSQ